MKALEKISQGPQDWGWGDFELYNRELCSELYYRESRTNGRTDYIRFELNFETNEYIEINKRVEEFFDYIANHLKKDFRPKDKIRIIIFG